MNMSIGDTITTSVVISNDGNLPPSLRSTRHPNAGEIDMFWKRPASFKSVPATNPRLCDYANLDALAAANYFATVWVSNADSGLTSRPTSWRTSASNTALS